MPSRSPRSARGSVPTSRSSTAGCWAGAWTRSTGSRSSCSRPASTSRPPPPPRRPPCSSAGAPCPATRTPTRRRCGGLSRLGSWPAAPPWSGWWTCWPSCWRARTMRGRCWLRSPAPAPTASAASVPGAADAGAAGGWTSTERARFATDLRAAVAEGIRPAFARLHDALASEIRPAARPAERPGLCHVPGGEAAYRGLARAHTSLDATPDELHRTGLAEIDRIDAELADLAGRTIGTPQPARRAGRPAGRSRAPLRDPRGGVRQGGLRPRAGDRGHPRRGSAASPWRRARSCAWVRTRRSTRPSPTTASRPTTARGQGSTTSTPPIRRPGRATRQRCSPITSPSPGTTSRSPSPRSSRTCRRSGATWARPRSSRAGACTRSASATRWASTPATSTGSACSASTPGVPRAWSWTPACTRWAGRGSRPSTSCSSTRPSRPTTSPTRSTATS